MEFARIRLRQYCLCHLLLVCCSLIGFAADEESPPIVSAETPSAAIAAHGSYAGSKAGEERSDNGLTLKLCWCPAGTFRMGTTDPSPLANSNEGPVEIVLTQGLWVGKFEVTQAQWKETVGTEPWKSHEGVKEEVDCPATWIRWDDANRFCDVFTKREHESGRLPKDWEYRLPTDAEWEYASRAGTRTRYSFGDNVERIAEYAWCTPETAGAEHRFAHPVGLKAANGWGLHDVHGNVLEWCRDAYVSKLLGGSDPEIIKGDSERRVARGGDWLHGSDAAYLARRESLPDSHASSALGFRVVAKRAQVIHEPTTSKSYRIFIGPFADTETSTQNRNLAAMLRELLLVDLSNSETVSVTEQIPADVPTATAPSLESGSPDGSSPVAGQEVHLQLSGRVVLNDGQLSIAARLANGGSAPIGDWMLNGSLDDLFRFEEDLVKKVLTDLASDATTKRYHDLEGATSTTLAILPLIDRDPNTQTTNPQVESRGDGFAEVIQSNLSAVSRISLVDRDRLNGIIEGQKPSAAGETDLQSAIKIAKLAGAHRVLVGSFLELKETVCVQFRMINSANATVIASHKLIRPRDQFAKLAQDLTRLVAADMGVPLLPDADEILARRSNFQRLETSVDAATIPQLARREKFDEAVSLCQRAISLEPGNLYFYREWISLLRSLNKNQDVLSAIETAVARPEFAAAPEADRKAVIGAELVTLFRLHRFADMIPAADRFKQAFPDPRSCDVANAWVCTALDSLNRGDEIVTFLEKNAAAEADQVHDWENVALRRLYAYYRDDAPLRLRSQVISKRMTFDLELSKSLTKKALAIYERVLKSVVGHQDEAASEWAKVLIPEITSISFVDKAGGSTPLLTPEQQLDVLRRGIQAFEWNPAVGSAGRFRLAQMLESGKKWEEAVTAYREVARSPQHVVFSSLPSTWDVTFDEPTSWIDRKIESYYRAAKILDESLERKADAREAYRELVREVGLAHFAGADALVAMQRLKIAPEFPQKSALIWGGETSAVLAWQKVLEPAGFKVHSLRELRLNPPQLTPYSLVVLNRSGNLPYTPREILALRSFVAAGGSLLVIVSPGWESAAVGIHNPLLSFFGMECQSDSLIEAVSTRLSTHPITSGMTQVTARNSIHIQANDAAAIVQAQDHVVLAATPYRFGRVVVASFGQWFLPDTSILPQNWKSLTSATRRDNIHLTPVEFGSRLETPLLLNVVRWLTEPQKRDAKFAAWRKIWNEAQQTAWRAQAHVEPSRLRLIPWDEMSLSLERAVKSAPDSIAKEESLWMAAEAFQQMGFYHFGETGAEPRPALTYPAYGYNPQKGTPLLPEVKYYQLLIQQFPQSSLRPYAEWRVAECSRRSRFVSGTPQAISTVDDVQKLIAEYEKVKVPARSYSLAWKNLRLGSIAICMEDYKGAIPRFQQIVDALPSGPERAMAMLNLALCHEKLNDPAESQRLYQLALQQPNIHWRPAADWFMVWAPLTIHPGVTPSAFGARGTTWQLARDGLTRLQKLK